MVELIHNFLRLFVLIIFADVIMSYIPELKTNKWARLIHKIADAPQKPIREALPGNMPLDPTPMIVIFLINILMYLL